MGDSLGALHERELVNFFRDMGYIAHRSAGSMGLDVVAVGKNHVYLIEAKATRQSKPYSYREEIEQVIEIVKNFPSSIARFLFWIRLYGKKYIVLTVEKNNIFVNLYYIILEEAFIGEKRL